MVFVGPVAEEIFFRGYVLEQLRKLTRSGIALLIQSLLFGLFHVYTRGSFTLVQTFLFGMILGAWRIRFRSLLPLVLAHVLLNATALIPLKARYDQAIARAHPTFMISKETTYITEPLRKDGFVDYVAALNQRFSQGVTPENNAAVLFWKAVGPETILPVYRDKYFQLLGVPPLPEKGDYFVDLDPFRTGRRFNYTSDQLTLAGKRPWSKQTFPVLAEWLAANEKPLTLAVEASKRPRRYDPLVCGAKAPLIAVPFPAVQQYRNLAKALCARAMLRLNKGRLDEAWEDLLTCHRLARLIGQGPTVIDALVVSSAKETACAGDQALLQNAHLTAAQATKMRADLNQLPAMPKMADKIDIGERFTYLDNVSSFSRDGVASLAGFLIIPDDMPGLKEFSPSNGLEKTIKSLIRYGHNTAVDWDLVLRMGNSWYDRIAEAYRKPTRAERRETLRKADGDFARLKKTAADAESLDKLMLSNPRQALSERVSQVLLIMFLPAIAGQHQVEDRWTMRFELDKLAFALAAYRADYGAYPAKLADLAPRYVVEVPKDIFNDSELHYRLEGKGYLLYSVGVNGKDDGGKSYEDHKKPDDDGDDLVVRVPAPEQK
jgi:hypothetical protein